MPGESFVENNVPFERRWFRFSRFMWVVLVLLLAASGSGLSGGGGPLAQRTSKSGGLEVRWERIARADALSKLRFAVEAPNGEARITLREGLASQSTLRDIIPPPKSVIAGRDALTLVFDVESGTSATVQMTQALEAPGILRSSVEAGGASINLEQIVLP
jgi:hypothetical protein